MTKNEQNIISMGCPECQGEIETYDTNPNGKGGKYRCLKCDRDTFWAVGTTLTIYDVLDKMKQNLPTE